MKNNYIEVSGYPNLVRDLNSGALLNLDFEKVRSAKLKKEQKKNATTHIETRLNALEKDIFDIKNMLSAFVETYK